MDAFDSAFVKARDAGASVEEADQKAGEQATAAVNQQMELERTTREHHGGHLIAESDGTKHLPTTSHGALDWGLLDSAYQALFAPEEESRIKEGPGKEKAKARLKELYDKEGIAWPGEVTQDIKPSAQKDLTAKVAALSEEKHVDYSVALTEVARQHPELAHAAREEVLGIKLGTPGSASAELAAMAEAVEKGRGISYSEAYSLVSRANPGLVRLARTQVLGLKPQVYGL